MQRKISLEALRGDMIDAPIIDIVNGINSLSCCFTIQCCYGHFIFEGHPDPHSIEPLPDRCGILNVEYRIAYVALCIDNSEMGKRLFSGLNDITAVDPENVQFCCADWFWERQINSYALQVEPDRFKHEDKAILDYQEALHIEKTRNALFSKLNIVLQKF
ncbi:MAG: hypothetical protein WC799_17155 [Desulfobacteraceae bacterium]